MGRRLYVGNLSWSTDNEALRSAFSECGSVKDVKIITDRESGQSRGFAFVEFMTDQEAENAIAKWHGQMLDGRTLTVNEAHEKAPRPNGGGSSFRSNDGPPRGGSGNGGGGSGNGGGGSGGRPSNGRGGSSGNSRGGGSGGGGRDNKRGRRDKDRGDEY